MAVDETLLTFADASSPPTLRFYRWAVPTLSLGYFQAADDRARHAASRDCSLVRRTTGGGGIVHDRELTYSFVTSQTDRPMGQSPKLYEVFHQTLAEALANWNLKAVLHKSTSSKAAAASKHQPFLCFQRRADADLVIDQQKVAGSAQRRKRGFVLQHGSVLLATSPHAPEIPGLAEIAGQGISLDELAQAWLSRLSKALDLRFASTCLEVGESRQAKEIVEQKFGAAAWTGRR